MTVTLENSIALFPIYMSIIDETTMINKELAPNQLVDVSELSMWVAKTGKVVFNNSHSPRCPEGFISLCLQVSPSLDFVETSKRWWE